MYQITYRDTVPVPTMTMFETDSTVSAINLVDEISNTPTMTFLSIDHVQDDEEI
jgi:hypothetical protein